MSHQSGELSDVFVPGSQFYQGPYGRMFRSLPAYVPTLDLIKGISFEGLPEKMEKKTNKILSEANHSSDSERLKIVVKDEDEAKKILKEVQKAYKMQNTEAGREAILKLLARTMIEKNHDQSKDDGDNDYIPAGYTYFSQFITHDITFDPTSSLMRFNDPNKIQNFRTPRLDLDSLYGNGPEDSPFLYDDKGQFGKLLVGESKWVKVKKQGTTTNNFENITSDQKIFRVVVEDDLPRNLQGRALIGDMRNDENIMISQLQLAFIKFHNKVLNDVIDKKGLKDKRAFQEAQRLVRWHYQWVILKDFLPRFVDHKILKEICDSSDCPSTPKLCYYQWRKRPFIPVEFSVAAFRFGHSMIRNRYTLNYKPGLDFKPIIPLPSRLPLLPSPDSHLLGFRRLQKFWTIQWDKFLKIEGSPEEEPQKSRKIDTQLSSSLDQLPLFLSGEDESNLAARDLLRGYKMGLPSGQAVARAMGILPLDEKEEPLWYYILREAEEQKVCKDMKDQEVSKNKKHQGGCKLGPVGSRIVAEVIIGLIAGDPHSYLNIDPGWKPTYKSQGSKFELRDILYHADVPLTKESLEAKFTPLED